MVEEFSETAVANPSIRQSYGRGGPLAPLFVTGRHLRWVLPRADRALDAWRARAEAIPSPRLRRQALESIDLKRFHCQGGSVFAAWSPAPVDAVVHFIVPFQTISDYLDTLCDRTDRLSGQDFRQLHQAMVDAVTPMAPPAGDYYRHHGERDDGGYLADLVAACRAAIAALPGYARVAERVKELVLLYIDLQVYKHLPLPQRVPKLQAWFEKHRCRYAALHWWEFAAAAGSTLAVFALVTEAARPRPIEEVEHLVEGYFPWICGLHILLDYLIDQEEDAREQDLNFVSFYRSPREAEERLSWMLERACQATGALRDPAFHRTVVEGLLGLYLSDPKVKGQGMNGLARRLIGQAGWRARAVHLCCRFWRLCQRRRAAGR